MVGLNIDSICLREAYLLRLIMAQGMPVGVLKAGMSLSAISAAFVLNIWENKIHKESVIIFGVTVIWEKWKLIGGSKILLHILFRIIII